jgi:hypothetical protein
MESAKARLTAAARAALAGDHRAQQLAADALRDMDRAREALRAHAEPEGVNAALLDALRAKFIGREAER